METILPQLTWDFDGAGTVVVYNRQELLTERERDVLQLIACGKSSKEIARHLNISVGGVNFHILNTMKKLDASTRAHAVARAIFKGLLVDTLDIETA